jgi:hypothetical protein
MMDEAKHLLIVCTKDYDLIQSIEVNSPLTIKQARGLARGAYWFIPSNPFWCCTDQAEEVLRQAAMTPGLFELAGIE